jgi:hypothetical protein
MQALSNASLQVGKFGVESCLHTLKIHNQFEILFMLLGADSKLFAVLFLCPELMTGVSFFYISA